MVKIFFSYSRKFFKWFQYPGKLTMERTYCSFNFLLFKCYLNSELATLLILTQSRNKSCVTNIFFLSFSMNSCIMDIKMLINRKNI